MKQGDNCQPPIHDKAFISNKGSITCSAKEPTNLMDENDKLAQQLDKEYGGSQPQDLHIERFCLILGNNTVERRKEVIAKLQVIGEWNNLESEWPGFIVGKFPKQSPSETEREREERLNREIRMQLLIMLANDPNNPPEITIGRVCKYTKEVVPRESLTTTDIEEAIKTPNDQHLDLFYLVVKLGHIPAELDINIIEEIKKLPGEWKTVRSPEIADQAPVRSNSMPSEESFTFIAIGYFPKSTYFESERQREWRLNIEVRDKLKQKLISHFEKKFPEDSKKKRVFVLFARACKYSQM